MSVPAGHPRKIRTRLAAAVPFGSWERRIVEVDGLQVVVPLLRFTGRHSRAVLDLKLARPGESDEDLVVTQWAVLVGIDPTWVRLIVKRRGPQERQLAVLFELPRDRRLLEVVAQAGVCDLADATSMLRVTPNPGELRTILSGDVRSYASVGATRRG